MRRLIRRWRYSRARTDRCETCGRWLRRGEQVEATYFFDCGETWGGSSLGTVTAVYCKADAPPRSHA